MKLYLAILVFVLVVVADIAESQPPSPAARANDAMGSIAVAAASLAKASKASARAAKAAARGAAAINRAGVDGVADEGENIVELKAYADVVSAAYEASKSANSAARAAMSAANAALAVRVAAGIQVGSNQIPK